MPSPAPGPAPEKRSYSPCPGVRFEAKTDYDFVLQTHCSCGSLELAASITHQETGLEGPGGAGSKRRAKEGACSIHTTGMSFAQRSNPREQSKRFRGGPDRTVGIWAELRSHKQVSWEKSSEGGSLRPAGRQYTVCFQTSLNCTFLPRTVTFSQRSLCINCFRKWPFGIYLVCSLSGGKAEAPPHKHPADAGPAQTPSTSAQKRGM